MQIITIDKRINRFQLNQEGYLTKKQLLSLAVSFEHEGGQFVHYYTLCFV